MTSDAKVSWLSASRIHTVLNIYLWLYAMGIIITIIYLLLAAFLLFEGQSISPMDIVSKISTALVLAALFFGIVYKKSWTPITITILSALGFISILFLMGGAQAPSLKFHFMETVYYCLLPLAALWQLFTLYFFKTKEVKDYFQVSGFIVF
jgi:hypothetical protein